MKNYFKKLTRSVWVVSAILVLGSCESDVWKDHYSYKSDSNAPVSTLAETIESIPGSAKFVQALKTTFMYNGDKELRVTYWDFLNGDQFLTVWLPSEGSISESEWAEYTSTDPGKDHKKIGTQFIMNHIARFSHPVGQTGSRSLCRSRHLPEVVLLRERNHRPDLRREHRYRRGRNRGSRR